MTRRQKYQKPALIKPGNVIERVKEQLARTGSVVEPLPVKPDNVASAGTCEVIRREMN